MKIVIELTDKEVKFLRDEKVETRTDARLPYSRAVSVGVARVLFHCCGEGSTGTEQNTELQKRLELIIKEQITAWRPAAWPPTPVYNHSTPQE